MNNIQKKLLNLTNFSFKSHYAENKAYNKSYNNPIIKKIPRLINFNYKQKDPIAQLQLGLIIVLVLEKVIKNSLPT